MIMISGLILLHFLFEIQSKDRVKKLVDETIIFHFLTSLLLKATKKSVFSEVSPSPRYSVGTKAPRSGCAVAKARVCASFADAFGKKRKAEAKASAFR